MTRADRILVLCCVAVPQLCLAQVRPDGWRSRLDRTAANAPSPAPALSWAEMVPGMHVTTGAGVVLLAPGGVATGRFMVDAEMLLFPDAGDRGYGIIIGGRDDERSSDSLAAHWIGFLVSADGKFTVVVRSPETTRAILDWRTHEAIVPRGKDVVTNRLRVTVERDSVRFLANGKQVGALPRSELRPEGLVGLRIDEGLNLHVTNVDVVKRLLRR